MFCLCFGFAMFRAESLAKTKEIIQSMLFFGPSKIAIHSFTNYNYAIVLIICFIASSYFSQRKTSWVVEHKSPWIYPLFILVNIFLILIFGVTESQNFLYFAF
jgi:alginate O-acetyltransferase complex protein AlgI